MRILITGHKGFVGSRLYERLLKEGHSVEGLDAQCRENLLTCELPENLDVIYHLAAHKSVEESWTNPGKYLENLRTMARLVHHYPDAKIIHSSSCAGDWPVASPYGFNKFAASKYLEAFHKNYVDLVFPNIFGGLQKQNSVVDTFKNAETLRVDDPSIIRDYVHVDDIVEGLYKALLWPTGRYSMGSGKGTTTLELAQATGKDFVVGAPRSGGKEPKESVVPNTTPDWEAQVDVLGYIHE